MSKFGVSLAIIIVLDVLFVAGGLLNSSESGTSCLFNSAMSLSLFESCSWYSSLLGVLSFFGALIVGGALLSSLGGIVIGTLTPEKLDQVATAGFTLAVITAFVPDTLLIFNIVKEGVGVWVAGILVAPIVFLIYQSCIDWWRSPTA